VKKGNLLVILLIFVFCVSMISAIGLDIETKPIVNTIINDHDKPAIFDFTITNNNFTSDFEVYTFERFRIEPSEFSLKKGQTKTLRFEFYAIDSMRENNRHVLVPVLIEQVGGSSQEVELDIKVVDFASAFKVGGKEVVLGDNTATIYFYNVENLAYENLEVILSSTFFDDHKETISMEPYEKKEIVVPINNEKLRKLVFGDYAVTASVKLGDKNAELYGFIKIVEKASVGVTEEKSGIFARKMILEKINEGNVPAVAQLSIKKNVVSRLFTTFSVEPSRVERKGFFVYYNWQKELLPDEKLSVEIVTNWLFPFLLIAAVIAIAYLTNFYFTRHLVIKKQVSFVKTKSNYFALKVILRVRTRRYIEKVRIYDRLPAMAKLYEKYGDVPKIEHGRLKWELDHLAEGEEKIFSYILYSKVKVIGKFELPAATGVYEIQGRQGEVKSNRAFFINEPRESVEYD